MRKGKDASPDMADAPGDPGTAYAPVGGGSDSDHDIEAPKKPRSAAQIAAFEKARQRLAENKAAKAAAEQPAPTPAAAAPAENERTEAAAPPPAAPAKTRKQRSDKGKPRGRLVRTSQHRDLAHAYSPPTWGFEGMHRRHGDFIVV